jgi:hypothetical protein
MQTRKVDKLIIYDDGEHKDLREDPVYKHLFRLMNDKQIPWEVAFGNGKGQHHGHEMANTKGFDFVWRLDDDEVAEPDVLERLLAHMHTNVGAVAGAVVVPGNNQQGGSNKIEDIFHMPNVQWAKGNQVLSVDHLYSSFLYRPGIAHYELRLSPVAHREETMFTNSLKQMGYELVVDTSIVTYHFRHDTGGIRDGAKEEYFKGDDQIFRRYLEQQGIGLIHIDTGLGDHIVFNRILPIIARRYKKMIIGCCYPDVLYKGPGIHLIPVGPIKCVADENVYGWMDYNKWSSSLLGAYKGMYGVA